jgi:hypothetical protein
VAFILTPLERLISQFFPPEWQSSHVHDRGELHHNKGAVAWNFAHAQSVSGVIQQNGTRSRKHVTTELSSIPAHFDAAAAADNHHQDSERDDTNDDWQ